MSGKIIEMRRPGGDHVCGYYYDRAAVLMSEGRYGEAEALIADGREAEPFNADLANLDGLVRMRKGDLESAIEKFGEAVLLDESRADLRNNLGTALLDLFVPFLAELRT